MKVLLDNYQVNAIKEWRNLMKVQLDMYQTIAVAVVVLMLGKFLKKRCSVLERFCIPAPVIGGVLFAIFTCICYATGIAEFEFDDILKEVCMVFFLYICRIPGESESVEKWRKVIDRIPWTGSRADRDAEFHGNRTFKASAYQSARRTLYRIDPNGRRSWYSRCFWDRSWKTLG